MTDLQTKICVEYVWLGGTRWDIRSKTRVLPLSKTLTVQDVPEWNFDGSSTGQATTEDSERILRPIKIIPDPIRGAPNKIVLCEVYDNQGKPVMSNFRFWAAQVFASKEVADQEVWFGIEQEYILMAAVPSNDYPYISTQPVAWRDLSPLCEQGPYYCSNGYLNSVYRDVAEEHLQLCLKAGLEISGINAEVFPGQWEFQIGICHGLDAADQLWLARYLLYRVCEAKKVIPNFDPKPIKGEWNGSGCHVNISTKDTRENPIKMQVIEKLMENMKSHHKRDLQVYGLGNQERLTGKHETSSMETFSWSVGGRHTSVRIPYTTEKNQTGYFEDRRPAANMDPYLVCGKIADSMLLHASKNEILEVHFTQFLQARLEQIRSEEAKKKK